FPRNLAFCTLRCRHSVSVLLRLHRKVDYRHRSCMSFLLRLKRDAYRQAGGRVHKAGSSRKAECTVRHLRKFASSPSRLPTGTSGPGNSLLICLVVACCGNLRAKDCDSVRAGVRRMGAYRAIIATFMILVLAACATVSTTTAEPQSKQ